MTDPALTYILSFTVAAFALLLIAVIGFYLKLTKKYVDAKSQTAQDNSDVVNQRNKIISDANTKSVQILDEANRKAQELIGSATNFNKVQSDVLDKQLQIANANYQKLFIEALSEVKKITETNIQNISKEVALDSEKSLLKFDQDISLQMNSLKKNLENKLIEFQKIMQALVESERVQMQKDYESIKASKLQKLDENILDAVSVVSREFLEKGLSPKDHEELIIKALEQAKADGILK